MAFLISLLASCLSMMVIIFASNLQAASLDFSITVSNDSMFRGTTATDHGPAIIGNSDFNHELIPNLSILLGTMATNVTAAAGRIEQDYYGTLTYNFANDFFIAPTFTYYTYYYLNRTNTFEYGLTGGHKRINAAVLYTDNYNGFKTSSTAYQLKGNVDLPKSLNININLAAEVGYLTFGDEKKNAWSDFTYYVISLSRTIETRTYALSYSDTIRRKEVYADGTKAVTNFSDQAIFVTAIQRF
ncbi:MAG: hypothetical protein HQK49_01740 [Oligoflexia bacterium]|nr:hypothetical protein [Oligoflexia bacterium]